MAINIIKAYKKYRGQWVAFKDDQKTVISSGKTAKEAYNKAIAKGFDSPILSHMPSELVKGFFEFFKIGFDYSSKEIEIKEIFTPQR